MRLSFDLVHAATTADSNREKDYVKTDDIVEFD
jgi:hypothetical protein